MSTGDLIEWPASALAAAEHAFAQLTAPPAPLALDGRAVGYGLPARHIPLDELRHLLVHDPAVSFQAKDAAWHLLISHARTWGPAWVIAAVGVALPGLCAMARRLAAGWRGQADDIESELLAGFLDALRGADLSGPAPYARLCWAGWRAALAARQPDHSQEMPAVFDPSSQLPTRPYGHPDLILGRAVRFGVISAEQAELISATRLGRVLIEELAARQGVDASVLRMRRRRGELAVVRALTDGTLEPGPRTARRGGGRLSGSAGGRVRSGQLPEAFADRDRPGLVGA